jgi:NADH-quinone oxidoreductase subunit L
LAKVLAHYYPLLIPLAPLVAAFLTALPGRFISEKNYRIGALAHAVAFGLSVLVLLRVAAPDYVAINLLVFPSPWTFLPPFALAIDRLSAVMMVLIAGIGTLLYAYSIRYMLQEHGRARYQTLLTLTISTLLFMVSSANLLMVFFFWQLLSWLLCLLTYNYAHAPTAQGAFRTFVILRTGDIAFLGGIVLAHQLYGTLEFPGLFLRAAADPATLVLFWPGSGLEIGGPTAVTLLIFIGAMSKSAQFPLHRWVPDTLYAPTPVSALLHAGIINAGGFLINRLAPLYGLSPWTLHVVFAVGLLTALVGAAMMLAQSDIKKTLGYSTVGQMGYMIMECGLGAFALAVFHLIAHGLFKATSFLNSGSVIRLARREFRRPEVGDAAEWKDFSPLTWAIGFLTSLVLPLIILLAAHDVLHIPLRDAQGVVVFLFFSWVTSSQAILTLYRLRAIGSWKVAGVMLVTLVLVMSTYLFAAERFTHFLYPEPGVVAAYFHSAALPGQLFDALIAVTALAITFGWFFIYAQSHGRSMWKPEQVPAWFGRVHARVYVLFANNVYLDGLALRVGRGLGRVAERLDRSRGVLVVGALLALGLGLSVAARTIVWSIGDLAWLGLAAVMLPLFPVHGVYVSALTRGWSASSGETRATYVSLAAGTLPLLGIFGLSGVAPVLPPELLRGVAVLAVFGALYGSIKALVQVRVVPLMAYGSMAFYAILWWQVAITGRVTPQGFVYAGSAVLLTTGVLLAWNRVRARYGDLDVNRIGGLAGPMPRLATLFALLVMAGVGLPPFGLFSGYIALLLDPLIALSFGTSVGLSLIVLVWFMASWYFFKLMQRLLCGPHRAGLRYEDLSRAEAAPLVLVLALLVAIGLVPSDVVALVGTNRLTGWNP